MNYIVHLYNFYQRANKDKRLKSWHMSLYMALFNEWNRHRFVPLFRILREKMMTNSHIGSKNTFGKALQQLHEFGYIVYHPALHPGHYVKITIILQKDISPEEKQPDLFTTGDNVPDMTDSVPNVTDGVPDIIDSVPDMTAESTIYDVLGVPDLGNINKQYKQRKQNKTIVCETHTPPFSSNKDFKIPTKEEILLWFDKEQINENGALAFFYHYSGNGWMIGQQPIRNWQAVAAKWLLTLKKSTDHGEQKTFHTHTRKNYENPL